MKHLKTFEARWKPEEQVDLFAELLNENPLSEDNDFYMFIAKDTFKEAKGGLYKKTLEIENMVRMTPDVQSIMASKGLEMRAMVQIDSKLYHIWLPKDIRSMVEGKGTNLESWIVDLIDKYKMRGTTEEGKKIYRNVVDRQKNVVKYNI